MLLTLLALAAPVLVGHTQLMEPRALVIGADIGHLLAGSFWIGGVLGLLLFLSSARVTGNGTAPTVAVKVVQRFSGLWPVWSVAILAVSGTIMGIMIVGFFDMLCHDELRISPLCSRSGSSSPSSLSPPTTGSGAPQDLFTTDRPHAVADTESNARLRGRAARGRSAPHLIPHQPQPRTRTS